MALEFVVNVLTLLNSYDGFWDFMNRLHVHLFYLTYRNQMLQILCSYMALWKQNALAYSLVKCWYIEGAIGSYIGEDCRKTHTKVPLKCKQICMRKMSPITLPKMPENMPKPEMSIALSHLCNATQIGSFLFVVD